MVTNKYRRIFKPSVVYVKQDGWTLSNTYGCTREVPSAAYADPADLTGVL